MSDQIGEGRSSRQRKLMAERNTKQRSRNVEPPRQRRPAMAALAVLLIVGGALVAGLVALRMDSREPVLAAAKDIPPGTVITEEYVTEVPVAGEGLALIPDEFADQILNGKTYAKVPISAQSLIDENMLTNEDPVGDGRAIVSVLLNPSLAPAGELANGDLVEVVRVRGSQGSGRSAQSLTEALVLSVSSTASDGITEGAGATTSATLLVPDGKAADVVDASSSNQAGIALLQRGQPLDVELEAD